MRAPALKQAISALVLALGIASVAYAQPAPDSIRTRRDCWRGAPLPWCRRFWLTEAAAEGSISGTHGWFTEGGVSYSRTVGPFLAWTFGPMVNRPSSGAVGGTVTFGAQSAGMRTAVEARYRRWTGGSGSLDVSAGFARTDIAERVHASGVTVSGAFGFTDRISATVRQDALRAKGNTLAATYVGIRLGTKPAVIGTVLVFAAVGALAASLAGTHWE